MMASSLRPIPRPTIRQIECGHMGYPTRPAPPIVSEVMLLTWLTTHWQMHWLRTRSSSRWTIANGSPRSSANGKGCIRRNTLVCQGGS